LGERRFEDSPGEKFVRPARSWWLTPVTLAIQEAEIRKITASPGKYFMRPYLEKTITTKGWWSGSRCRP
jgi:hypothetical protein